jgi:pilus assembly protein Flp/PilA
MDRFRSTLGALADWVGRRVVWLRAALAEGQPGERGQGLVEYALIISLIALVVLGALTLFGVSLEAVFLDPIASEVTRVFEGM